MPPTPTPAAFAVESSSATSSGPVGALPLESVSALIAGSGTQVVPRAGGPAWPTTFPSVPMTSAPSAVTTPYAAATPSTRETFATSDPARVDTWSPVWPAPGPSPPSADWAVIVTSAWGAVNSASNERLSESVKM